MYYRNFNYRYNVDPTLPCYKNYCPNWAEVLNELYFNKTSCDLNFIKLAELRKFFINLFTAFYPEEDTLAYSEITREVFSSMANGDTLKLYTMNKNGKQFIIPHYEATTKFKDFTVTVTYDFPPVEVQVK